MKITKLKHSCLLIENENQRIIIDPSVKLFDEDFDYKNLGEINYCLFTHAHHDHSNDVEELVSNYPKIKFYANYEFANILVNTLNISADNVKSFANGCEMKLANLNFKVVPALHSNSYKGIYAGDACGFVVGTNNTTYIVGDSGYGPHIDFVISNYGVKNLITPYDGKFNLSWKDLVKINEKVQDLNYFLYHDDCTEILSYWEKEKIQKYLKNSGLNLITSIKN